MYLARSVRHVHRHAPFGAHAGQRSDGQQSHPRGTVDRPVTVPEAEGRLLTASRLLSPHGTEMRARTRSGAPSTRSSSRARRSQCDRHPSARDARRRVNPREISGEKATAPRIAPGGRCLLTPLAKFAWKDEWLLIGSRSPTRSQRSRRDGFARLAPSRKCERLRIQAVGRHEPGRSHGFAASRDECGPSSRARERCASWTGDRREMLPYRLNQVGHDSEEPLQEFLERHGRPVQVRGLGTEHVNEGVRIEVEQIAEELVG